MYTIKPTSEGKASYNVMRDGTKIGTFTLPWRGQVEGWTPPANDEETKAELRHYIKNGNKVFPFRMSKIVFASGRIEAMLRPAMKASELLAFLYEEGKEEESPAPADKRNKRERNGSLPVNGSSPLTV